MTELAVILVIALLIFGPDKLPGLARSLGKGFGEFRRASYDLRQSLVDAAEPDPPPRTARAETIHRPGSEAPERDQPKPDQTTPPAKPGTGPQGGGA